MRLRILSDLHMDFDLARRLPAVFGHDVLMVAADLIHRMDLEGLPVLGVTFPPFLIGIRSVHATFAPRSKD